MSDDRGPKKSVAPFTFIKGFLSGVLFATVINKYTFIGAGTYREGGGGDGDVGTRGGW